MDIIVQDADGEGGQESEKVDWKKLLRKELINEKMTGSMRLATFSEI